MNRRVRSKMKSSVGVKGTVPLTGVPINAIVRGVRAGPNGNNRLVHSTNADTRMLKRRNGCALIHLGSDRMHLVLSAYHTAVNSMNGRRRRLVGVNGTKHGH